MPPKGSASLQVSPYIFCDHWMSLDVIGVRLQLARRVFARLTSPSRWCSLLFQISCHVLLPKLRARIGRTSKNANKPFLEGIALEVEYNIPVERIVSFHRTKVKSSVKGKYVLSERRAETPSAKQYAKPRFKSSAWHGHSTHGQQANICVSQQ